jgi:hypothetical protein
MPAPPSGDRERWSTTSGPLSPRVMFPVFPVHTISILPSALQEGLADGGIMAINEFEDRTQKGQTMRPMVSKRNVLTPNGGRFLALLVVVMARALLSPFSSVQEVRGKKPADKAAQKFLQSRRN